MTAPDTLRIALAQLNPTVGDVAGNLAKARAAQAEAARAGADLVAFSELFIAGYTPEDLVRKPAFLDACRAAVEDLAAGTADGGPAVLMGAPWREGDDIHNAAVLLDGGRIAAVTFKHDLPNYDVFDEKRVFDAGPLPSPLDFRGVKLGVPVCEDIWSPDAIAHLTAEGAELLIVPNGSPYTRGKVAQRMEITGARVAECGLPMIYVNQVCGQDELVFDGGSFVLQADGAHAAQLPQFVEAVTLTTWRRGEGGWTCDAAPRAALDSIEKADYRACVLGLKDYVDKNRFPGVVLGLSGGIDSALVAAMAVDALGAARVHGVMMPYRYTSPDSLADAEAIARLLGLRYDIVPVFAGVEGLEASLKPLFEGLPRDTTEENLQSRARGTILMSISNKFGPMVLTTGNKSEMSVGYATLYGDMNGGFNPIKDLYKTEVFRLCALRNGWKPEGALGPDGPVMPENVIVKPPTAELRENQKDEDSLPPYDVLDPILERLVEREMRVRDIVADGFEEATVRKVERLLYIAEYKRRQAAPGVKVTRKNFGRDRRYPITNGFRDR